MNFSTFYMILLIPQTLFMIMGIRLHQDMTFKEVTDPRFEKDPEVTIVQNEDTVIVVAGENVTKAYPLVYVAHHHVVNDKVNNKNIAITFCPMCNSVVVYDTSDLGRLFVATLHHGNLVLADYRTKTYFQQNTGEYLTGPLIDTQLEPIFYEQTSYGRAKEKYPDFLVAKVSKEDLSPFELPIPGLWQKLLRSEYVPTLDKKKIDKRLPAREKVVGVDLKEKILAYKKEDILKKGYVHNKENEFLLVAVRDHVEGYKFSKEKEFNGSIKETDDLEQIRISDEYWFSWSFFHPMTKLLTID
jgi:hypothetical protein